MRAKKYFYVLRPILARRWIREKGTTPPMRFDEFLESQLEAGLKSAVQEPLEPKTHAPERREIRRVEILNEYPEKASPRSARALHKCRRNQSPDGKSSTRCFYPNCGADRMQKKACNTARALMP